MEGLPLRTLEEISICSRLTNWIKESSTSIPYFNNTDFFAEPLRHCEFRAVLG